jgi:hypothetical protein
MGLPYHLLFIIYTAKFFVKHGTCISVTIGAMSKKAVGSKASTTIL